MIRSQPVVALQRPTSRIGWSSVSALGLGTVKFGRNRGVKYPSGDGFRLPSDREIGTLLDTALASGINLLDTAPAYGSAEQRLGDLLGHRRDRFFIVTKTGEEFVDGRSVHDFSAAHTRESVERSLKRLRTDFIDCALVHCSHDDANVLTATAALEVLARLKDQGKIGSFGASTYTLEGGRLAVDLCDCVMVAYNRTYLAERDVVDYAHRAGKPVLVKKGLASGHIEQLGDLSENIRFIIDTPGVTCLIFGSLDPAHIRTNVEALAGAADRPAAGQRDPF
jgi:aryl-alcohol dehydrogenase-like predicted oxidoreductase